MSGRNKTSKSRIHSDNWSKEKKITCGNKEIRNKKGIPLKNEKASRNQALWQKSFENDKYLGSPSCKLLGTIPKNHKGKTQIKRQEH